MVFFNSSDGPRIRANAINYDNGDVVYPHCHRAAQLIFAVSGVMEVKVGNTLWRVPPQRAVWMPSEAVHSMQALSAVELRTLYIAANAVTGPTAEKPRIIAVSPLLRELILRGIEIPDEIPAGGLRARVLLLAMDELERLLDDGARAPERSLPMPSGADRRITRICESILEDPGQDRGLEDWAKTVGASKRTLARRFQDEFGMSFLNWRQQVRVAAALLRLDQGDPVTVIAADLGYETPAAFSLMFRKVTGQTPSQYRAQARPAEPDTDLRRYRISGGSRRAGPEAGISASF